MKTSDILSAARTELEINGWIQNLEQGPAGEVCLGRALYVATCKQLGLPINELRVWTGTSEIRPVFEAVAKVLPDGPYCSPSGRIVSFNDKRDTTLTHVYDVLEHAIKLAQEDEADEIR